MTALKNLRVSRYYCAPIQGEKSLFPRLYLRMFSKSVPLRRRKTITIQSRHVHGCIPQIGPGRRGALCRLCLNTTRYMRTRHTCVLYYYIYIYVYTYASYDPSTKQYYGRTHQVLSMHFITIISIKTIGYGVCMSSSRKVRPRYGQAVDHSRVGVKSCRDHSSGLSKRTCSANFLFMSSNPPLFSDSFVVRANVRWWVYRPIAKTTVPVTKIWEGNPRVIFIIRIIFHQKRTSNSREQIIRTDSTAYRVHGYRVFRRL